MPRAMLILTVLLLLLCGCCSEPWGPRAESIRVEDDRATVYSQVGHEWYYWFMGWPCKGGDTVDNSYEMQYRLALHDEYAHLKSVRKIREWKVVAPEYHHRPNPYG